MSDSKKKTTAKVIFVRIVAIILAVLMLLSVAYLAIMFIIEAFTTESSAAESTDELSGYAMNCNVGDRDFLVSVAIRFTSGVLYSYSLSAPYGFVIGEGKIERTSRSFKPIYRIEDDTVIVACDVNLTVGYQSCTKAASAARTDIGANHVELSLSKSVTDIEIWDTLDTVRDLFGDQYEQVFPAYINGEKKIRIGAFATYTLASEAAAVVLSTLDGYDVSVASPATNGMTVLNEDCDEILFEYDGGDAKNGGVCAVQKPGATHVYTTFNLAGIQYDGAFLFRKYSLNGYEGFTLINLVWLLEYCEGVLPAEIYPSWDVECMKAFAITVNCFTIANRNKQYNAFGCDFTASSADQNYRGRYLVNDKVIEACEGTKNTVLTYEKKTLVNGVYTSSQGGCSVAPEYVWSGSMGPFMVSQYTPWENYMNYSGGFWKLEVTPANLCAAAKKAGLALSGTTVTAVSTVTTGDSPYVYTMTFTDNKGKKASLYRCSPISSLITGLGGRSANFVIGKGSVAYTYEQVLDVKIVDLDTNYSGNLTVKTDQGTGNTTGSLLKFITGLASGLKDTSGALYVKTGEGTAILASEKDIPVSTLPGADGIATYVTDYGSFLIVSKIKECSGVYRANSSANFAIVGKGFGHGVGMSAFGMNELATRGAKVKHILGAYFPGTELTSLYDYWKAVGLAN